MPTFKERLVIFAAEPRGSTSVRTGSTATLTNSSAARQVAGARAQDRRTWREVIKAASAALSGPARTLTYDRSGLLSGRGTMAAVGARQSEAVVASEVAATYPTYFTTAGVFPGRILIVAGRRKRYAQPAR